MRRRGMGPDYSKLFKILKERHILKSNLADRINLSRNILSKLGKNQYVSLWTLERICEELHVDIGDIMTFNPPPPPPDPDADRMSVDEIEKIIFGDRDKIFEEAEKK